MTRTFYSYAIFFTAIYILVNLLHSLVYLKLDARFIELSSLREWIIFSTAVNIVWSLIVLAYYHHKQYTAAFITLVITVIAGIAYFFIYYRVLSTHELSPEFFISITVVLIASLAQGIALVFSKASERPWLKISGVATIFLELVMIASMVWAVVSVTARLNGSIDLIHKWASLAGSLIPLFFVLNFLHERKPAKEESSGNNHVNVLTGFVSLAACIGLFIFAPKFATEAINLSGNPDYVNEWVKAPAQIFEADKYMNKKGGKLPYRLLKPLAYDSTRKYPLVVCLHGSSGCGADNAKQILSSIHAYLLSQDSMRIRYPAFVFVPQCPMKSTWGGFEGVPSMDSLVVETIVALQNEYPIDEKRLYLMGNSMGGYGTWHIASTRPELFAAAVPICGGGDPALAEKLVNVPVWAFHGAKDMNVPVSGSRQMIEAIRNKGGNPKYTEYPEEAHDISRNVIDTPELLTWMFAQRRN